MNINEILIRPMQWDDIEKMLNNFIEQGWSKPKEVLEKYLAGQADNTLYVFIAEYKNDVAGYVVLYPYAKNGAFANKNIPDISDFNVYTKYQRKGIGKLILDAAEGKAAQISNSVSLGVGLHPGYGAAQRIYIKRGYVPDGSGIWYNNSLLPQNAPCENNDDLVLYMLKEFNADK